MFYNLTFFKFYRLLSTTYEVIEYAEVDPYRKFGQHCKNDLILIWQEAKLEGIYEFCRGADMESEQERLHSLIGLLYSNIAFLERVFCGQKYVIYKNRLGVLCLWSTSQTIEELTDFLIDVESLD